MGPASSSLLALVPEESPLACLLKHLKNLDPDNLKKKNFIFLCTEAWTKYPLGNRQRWLPQGSIHYNTILKLDLFCKREEKWTEFPYAQLFFSF
jgi:hypothetical protein